MKKLQVCFVVVFLSGCVCRPSPGPSLVERMLFVPVDQKEAFAPLPMGPGRVPGLADFRFVRNDEILIVIMRIDWIRSPEVDPEATFVFLEDMFVNRILDGLFDRESENPENIRQYFIDGLAEDRLEWLVNEGLYSRRVNAKVRVQIVGAELWYQGELNDRPQWTWAR